MSAVKKIISCVFFFVSLGCVYSQIDIPNSSPLTQNFDGMGSGTTLPANWRMFASSSSPTWAGAAASVTQQASSGSPTAGGTYNFGTSGTERAVGAMSSGGFPSPSSLIARYRNTNTLPITQLTVDFHAERYRINTSDASIQFFYSTDGSTWTSVPAGDIGTSSFPTGSSSYTFASPLTIIMTGVVISSLNIPNNGEIFLRWNFNTTGTNSQGIAIDNVSVVADFACTAPSVQASSFTSTALSDQSIQIGWTRGNGSGVLVLAKSGSAVSSDPISGTAYSASSVMGMGSLIGVGNYAVYSGTGTVMTLTGLLPSTTYHFAIYEYTTTGVCYNTAELTGNRTTLACTVPTTVSGFSATPGNNQATFSWVNPTCFDEMMVVVKPGSAVSATPTGDGSAYTASLTFGSGSLFDGTGRVVYKGSTSGQVVSNLVNGTLYHVAIFTRKGTLWSAVQQVMVTPASTVLKPGDLMFVGFDSYLGAAGVDNGDDRVCIVNLVELTTGTNFSIANASYEKSAPTNVRTDLWYSCTSTENGNVASMKLTYNGSTPIAKGSVICLNLGQNGGINALDINCVNSLSGFSVVTDGQNNDVNFSSSNPDQIWLMQGTWNIGAAASTFTGYVLGGITNGADWVPVSDPPINSNERRSRKHPHIECMSQAAYTSTTRYVFARYNTAAPHSGSQNALITAISDPANWTLQETGTAATAQTAAHQFPASFCTETFTVSGVQAVAGKWTGATSTDWFNCGNWENYSVPDETIDVTIAGTATRNCSIDRTSANALPYGSFASCRDLFLTGKVTTISTTTGNSLQVHRDLRIEGDAILINNASGGVISLYGNWTKTGSGTYMYGSTTNRGLLSLVGLGNQFIASAGVESLAGVVLRKTSGNVVLLQNTFFLHGTTLASGLLSTSGTRLALFPDGAMLPAIFSYTPNSYITGPMITYENDQPIFFPIGKNGKYAPCYLSAPPNGLGGGIRAEYFNTPYVNHTSYVPPITLVSAREYWSLSISGSVVTPPNLTLYWFDGAFSGISSIASANDLRVAHWNGTAWEDFGNNGTTGTAASGTITANAISAFSPFTFGKITGVNPLPVSDFYLVASLHEANYGVIRLETTHKKGPFTLYKSTDALRFVPLHRWSENEPLTEFVDTQLEGTTYYKALHEPTSEYSETVSLQINNEAMPLIEMYPNPSTRVVHVKSTLPIVSVKIFDATLAALAMVPNLQSLHPNYTFEVSHLHNGLYYVQITGAWGSKILKLIKK